MTDYDFKFRIGCWPRDERSRRSQFKMLDRAMIGCRTRLLVAVRNDFLFSFYVSPGLILARKFVYGLVVEPKRMFFFFY